MNKEQLRGSQTAKNGFKNEDDIIDKFNNWEFDEDAKIWLMIMNYDLNDIEFVKAIKISGFKTDVQVQITIKLKSAIDAQNIQIKLVSNPKGFNQIDKRWINKYVELWSIPENIVNILKRYTGEIKPNIPKPSDKRRMFINEFPTNEQIDLKHWLNNNKSLIISDIIKGRGQFATEWMLVAQILGDQSRWILKPINICLNHFSQGDIEFTNRGNIKLGRITIQRKGGDGGRKTSQMLQFKINPAELFVIN
jgi:hypothetical protein